MYVKQILQSSSSLMQFYLFQVSAISALSTSSCGSRESVAVGAGEVRRRLADATAAPPPNAFKHDPADPSATALKVRTMPLLHNIVFIELFFIRFALKHL